MKKYVEKLLYIVYEQKKLAFFFLKLTGGPFLRRQYFTFCKVVFLECISDL